MRGEKHPSKEIRRLVASGAANYWVKADRRQRRHLRVSRMWLSLRDRSALFRQDSRVLATLLRSVLAPLAITAVVVGALEAIAEMLQQVVHWGGLFAPVAIDSYATLVGAAVGAEAVFLALFFTTVGVIASTTYADVPAEIRGLFIRERTSLLYVWSVTMALLVGFSF